jgi:tRNA(adenine34) deaminase
MLEPLTILYAKALQAEAAVDRGEIPVGAVIVIDNRIIASCHNPQKPH